MKNSQKVVILATSILFLASQIAFATETSADTAINTGDTAWVMISAALVFFMIPGLAFFYGGMVRSKNVLGTIMQSFFLIAIISVEWILIGYTLAFGEDVYGIIGDFSKAGLSNIDINSTMGTIPEFAFITFQCMFAALTPALITGAFAGRMRFSAFILFSLLWSLFIYNLMAHWVWGGGWLASLGALDFAGGLVIHILSGVSGLVLCLMLGKRRGYGNYPMLPHHLPMVILGTSILWIGWFGFNAGSALGANGLAANALIVSQAAAAAGTIAWVLVEWCSHGKPTLFGAASGCISGLVAITPAAGFVTAIPAILIGFISGSICYFAVAVVKNKLKYDDSLDVFGIHGIGGIWGAIATGLWANTKVNPDGANGLFYGNPELLWIQILSVITAIFFATIGTFAIVKTMNLFMQIRVNEEEEAAGLDLSQHGERGYEEKFLVGSAFDKTPNSNREFNLNTTLN